MDRPTPRIPHVNVALTAVDALQKHSVVAALGGSGLLAALGLTDQVRDWDLTTDAEPEQVLAALDAAEVQHARTRSGDGGYATRARIRIDGGDHEVDLLVGFGFQIDGVTVPMPTRVTGHWRRLPLGNPAVWAQAYRLMGRTEKADLLQTWLGHQTGLDQTWLGHQNLLDGTRLDGTADR
jgi:hypothetical protein